MKKLFPVVCLLSCLIAPHSFAASATWNLNPTSGDWNTAANWTPATVPNGPSDTATFGTSNTTSVTASTTIEVNSVVFNPGANVFSIIPASGSLTASFVISGAGVINNSGVTQNFVINSSPYGDLNFLGSATAGDSVVYTVNGGASFGFGYTFYDDTTAATATFVINGGTDSAHQQPGFVTFRDNSTAENASLTVNGGRKGAFGGVASFTDNATAGHAHFFLTGATEQNAAGGFAQFAGTATADQAVIMCLGSDTSGGGTVSFFDSATAGTATLIAKAGKVSGGRIIFEALAGPDVGGMANIKVFGNGQLINYEGNTPVEIASLEGDGLVSLGVNALKVGNNQRDATFSGVISGTGSFEKIGFATVTLTGLNTYSGGTTVSDGTLVIAAHGGSALGSGPVQIEASADSLTGLARLVGTGILSNSVTVGTGGRGFSYLAPGFIKPGNLTIDGDLTFNADGNYECYLNTNRAKADRVTARSVTIANGGFALVSFSNATLPVGQVFIVLSNQAPGPINGRFVNLPDGGTITTRSNTFQANYEGGDGNDLTLTVVQ